MAFLIGGANSAADTGFSVANSCRFDGSSAYMHKTPGGEGDKQKWTFSTWVKRSLLGVQTAVDQHLISADAGNCETYIYFLANSGSGATAANTDCINVYSTDSDGNVEMSLRTTPIYRDISAWYHVCVAIDTTQSTDTNRAKIYVNGTQVTTFSLSTYPAQNENLAMCDDVIHEVARRPSGTTKYFNGYLAETVLIDGSQLAPTSFGEFNEDSPTIWQPIDVSGLTFGTNGFYLDYEDSANLGNDKNGGTDLTEVNLAATDQCQDSPTNNFATLNSIDGVISISDYAFTEGNCKVATGTNSNKGFARSNIGVAAGKWYMEFKLTSLGEHGYCGISNNACQDAIGETMGVDTLHNVYEWAYKTSGTYLNSNTNTTTGTSYGDSFDTGDIIGIALNLDDNELKFYKNNAVQASGTAIDITAIASNPTGFYFFACGEGAAGSATTWEANFGNPSYANSSDAADANGYGAFEYAPPSGFLALCTKNLGSDGG